MLQSVFTKPGSSRRWVVNYFHADAYYSLHHKSGGCSGGMDLDTAAEARAQFERWAADLMAAGWAETERSLSRRAFVKKTGPARRVSPADAFVKGMSIRDALRYPRRVQAAKFWAVALDGPVLVVQFGRVPGRSPGSDLDHLGQTRTKEFDTPESARREYEKLIAAKRREGYREVARRPIPGRAAFPASTLSLPAATGGSFRGGGARGRRKA